MSHVNRTARAACITFLIAACAPAQQADVAPSFDAASVKVSGPPARGSAARFLPGGRLEVRNSPLIAALKLAYDVTEFRIAGAPAWVTEPRTALFDIDAAAPPGDVTPARLRLMLQALLADRFRLQMHREVRSVPVYALLPGKNGIRLKPAPGDSKTGDKPTFDFNPYGGHIDATNALMPDFIRVLERWLDRPVVDRTGFSQAFNAALSWAPGPENSRNALPFPPNADDPRASIFTAVQDQLGLRLNAERDPLDVIVIDRVETPSPN